MRKFVIFSLILFLDFSTKYWISHNVPLIQPFEGFPFGGIGVFDTEFVKFSIVHTTNKGIAWGMLANYQTALLICRILITLGIIGYLSFSKPPKQTAIPLTLVAAGATGNIIDYFLYGHVIDMFYFIFYTYSYPIFNVADSAIFCGVAVLLFSSKKIRLRRHAKYP